MLDSRVWYHTGGFLTERLSDPLSEIYCFHPSGHPDFEMAHFSIPGGIREACRRLIGVAPTLTQHIDNML